MGVQLGVFLGDYVVPAFWSLYGVSTGHQMYIAFPHSSPVGVQVVCPANPDIEQ
jgi:hypothetical protein